MSSSAFNDRVVVHRAPEGTQRTFLLDNVVVNEFHLAAGFRPGPHPHEGPHVCVILSGAFEERSGRAVIPCGPGMARFSPAQDVHDLRVAPGGLHCFVIEACTDVAIEAPRHRAYLRNPDLRLLAEGLLRAADDPHSCVLEIDMLGLELLMSVVREGRPRGSSKPPEWLREAHAKLTADVSEPLRVSALADELGVHRVHLAQSFRRFFGTSPGEFLRRRRCLHARTMLVSTNVPIAQIALDSGFVDQSHLTHMMRRYLGVSPGSIRRESAVVSGGKDFHPYKSTSVDSK